MASLGFKSSENPLISPNQTLPPPFSSLKYRTPHFLLHLRLLLLLPSPPSPISLPLNLTCFSFLSFPNLQNHVGYSRLHCFSSSSASFIFSPSDSLLPPASSGGRWWVKVSSSIFVVLQTILSFPL